MSRGVAALAAALALGACGVKAPPRPPGAPEHAPSPGLGVFETDQARTAPGVTGATSTTGVPTTPPPPPSACTDKEPCR